MLILCLILLTAFTGVGYLFFYLYTKNDFKPVRIHNVSKITVKKEKVVKKDYSIGSEQWLSFFEKRLLENNPNINNNNNNLRPN